MSTEARVTVCRNCSTELPEGAVVCPSCDAVLTDPNGLKRKKTNIPKTEDKLRIVSDNYNGLFLIKQASDGSYVCTCPSFLLQSGIRNGDNQNGGIPFSTCKHIRNYLQQTHTRGNYTGKPPSDWQRLLLRTLGVDDKSLSNAQAYFLIGELLELRGIPYHELTWFLKNQKKPSLLPLVHYGVEIEGNIQSRTEFRRVLTERGISVTETGYTGQTRAANEWRISCDSSVHTGDKHYQPVELVSPKLFGYRGFLKLKQVLDIWNEIGADYVKSAGTHVHLDMYDVADEFKTNLLFVWATIEIPYMWYLVAPSRRNNSFCRAINNDVISEICEGEISSGRYYSLNFSALHRHGTVEFRLFNCTTDWQKVTAWTTLVLLIYDAVRKGFTYKDVPKNDFSGFLDKIGFGENACRFLKETKEYLIARYNFFKKDAEEHPGKVPAIRPPVISDAATMARVKKLIRMVKQAKEIRNVINENQLYSWYNSRQDWLPIEYQKIYEIAKGRINKLININSVVLLVNNLADNPDHPDDPHLVTNTGAVLRAQLEVDRRRVNIVNQNGMLIPVCGCSYAVRNSGQEKYCYHIRYAARYILRKIVEEKIEEMSDELERLQEEIDEVSDNDDLNYELNDIGIMLNYEADRLRHLRNENSENTDSENVNNEEEGVEVEQENGEENGDEQTADSLSEDEIVQAANFLTNYRARIRQRRRR